MDVVARGTKNVEILYFYNYHDPTPSVFGNFIDKNEDRRSEHSPAQALLVCRHTSPECSTLNNRSRGSVLTYGKIFADKTIAVWHSNSFSRFSGIEARGLGFVIQKTCIRFRFNGGAMCYTTLTQTKSSKVRWVNVVPWAMLLTIISSHVTRRRNSEVRTAASSSSW